MMRKKSLFSFPVILLTSVLVFSGCASQETGRNLSDNTSAKIEQAQIRNICELATLKCTYHNIAKSTKPAGEGLLDFGKKERKFWIDYQGTVEISFDVSKMDMEQDGADIRITLPEPTLTCSIVEGSWNSDSYITEPDNKFFQKNPITADDQTQAISNAQEDMKEQVRNDSSLVKTAQGQAEDLIRNYIGQIGALTGTEYKVTFTEKGSTGTATAKSE